ncbi:MAG TPA: 30S ribosomal protein S4 [archaeon]|nr:30S ribosomal protein S4 [archaeon]
MGQPKRFRKKYARPKKPFDKARIETEKKTKENFGLRRKKEIWRAEGIVRDFRRRARALQAKGNEKDEKALIDKINKLGIFAKRLDDVLQIGLDDILSRRLQTIIFKKGLANSMKHARQLIVHGHVTVSEKKVSWPSYIVEKDDEDKIALDPYITAKMIKEETKKE